MILMHENTPVANVELSLGYITKVNEVYSSLYLPIGTNHPGNMLVYYLSAWQKDRAIPFNRSSIDSYRKYFGCSALEAAQIFGSFSLTDHYWFKEDDSDEKWEDACFQLNGFSTDLSNFFLNVITGNTPEEGCTMKVPDANTDGVLPKMWTCENGVFKLIKLGNYEELDGIHLLSANEVACSRIAKLMGIDAVTYDGITLPGMHSKVCVSECFVSPDQEFVTLAQVLKSLAGKKVDLYGHLCDAGYKKELEDMIRFFFLIHNKDGHLKNCGFLRNAKTLKVEKFAPLFDNGCSLGFDGLLGHMDMSVKPFRESRLEQVSLLSEWGELPSFEQVSKIIMEVYRDFSIPDALLDNALQDLMETYDMWERLVNKDKDMEQEL